MTVATAYAPLTYSGNSATVAFAASWPFFTGSLVVTLIAASGTQTVQTLGTHYSVTGGTDSNGLPATGTVTMVTAPVTGASLRIVRATARTQAAVWADSDPFPAKVVESAFDKTLLLAQEALYLAENPNPVDVVFSTTATTGAAGSSAVATVTESPSNTFALALTIPRGNPGAGANFNFVWSTNTAASDPGSSYVKGNNAALGSITTLYISETALEGAIGGAQTALLSASTNPIRGTIWLLKSTATNNFVVLDVTNHVDSGVYRTLTVTVTASAGSFAADDVLLVGMARSGDQGTGAVSSFNTRTGAVTLTSGDVTGALTYTPANKAGDTFTGSVILDNIDPEFRLRDSDAAVDGRIWRDQVAGVDRTFTVYNDALSAFETWLRVTRSGATITFVDFLSLGATELLRAGNVIWDQNNVGARINALTTTAYDSAADFVPFYDVSGVVAGKVLGSTLAPAGQTDTRLGSEASIASPNDTTTRVSSGNMMTGVSIAAGAVSTLFFRPVQKNLGAGFVTVGQI